MPISTTTNIVKHLCNGVITSFAFAFPIAAEDDIVVSVRNTATGIDTLLATPQDYNVSDVNGTFAGGGTVNTVTSSITPYAHPTGSTLCIRRTTPKVQASDYAEGIKIPPQSLEANLNNLTMMVQELETATSFMFRAPYGDTASLTELPNSVDRASKYLFFDAAGQVSTTALAPSVLPVNAEYRVDALMDYGSGIAHTQGTIEAACTDVGTVTKTRMILRPGTWTVGSDMDLSAYDNITFEFADGAVISHGGYAVSIPVIVAGCSQIFSGTGQVIAALTSEILPEWFGDDVSAIQKALYTAGQQNSSTAVWTPKGAVVPLRLKTYAVSDTVVIPEYVELKGPGGGHRQCVIQTSSSWIAANPVVQLGNALGTNKWAMNAKISNITVDANHLANVGIYSDCANEGSGVDTCWVKYPLLYGIEFYNPYAGGTENRLLHPYIRDTQVVFDTIAHPTQYPDLTLVKGVYIHGYYAWPFFGNVEVTGTTITNANNQVAGSEEFIGVGFQVEGIEGVSLFHCHSEYAAVDFRIGTAAAAARAVHLIDCEGQGYAGYTATTVEISHAQTFGVVIDNLWTTSNYTKIVDYKNSRTITTTQTIPHYVIGNETVYGDVDITGTVTLTGPAAVVGRFIQKDRALSTDSDDLDVSGVNIVAANTSGGNVTLGGLSGGVLGQVVFIAKATSANILIIENDEATGTQKIKTASGGDILITGVGGIILFFNGTAWIEINVNFAVSVPSATETTSGIVELSTNAESVSGSATDKVITPANLTARLAAPGTIGGTTPAAGNFTSIGGSSANITGDASVGGKLVQNSAALSTSTDAFDVAGVNIISADSSGGNIVLGGLANGANEQVVYLFKGTVANSVTITHQAAGGTQKINTPVHLDIVLTEYGGVTMVCNGTSWTVLNHA